MSLRHSHRLSAAALDANRRNAQRSTGPRTSRGKRRAALNALRDGLWAKPDARLRQVVLKLGEDPEELDSLEQSLRQAWQPADPMQAMLVRDLAHLYWNKLRAERALAALHHSELCKHEFEQEKQRVYMAATKDLHDVFDSGYRSGWESETKFEKCLETLDRLLAVVEGGQDWKDAAAELQLLYGFLPTGLGKEIKALFERKSPQDLSACGEIKKLMLREKEEVAKERELYRRGKTDPELKAKQLAGAPLTREWFGTIRQDAALDRQISGKVRLLMRLQSRRRKTTEKRMFKNEERTR